jgi:hypothetical protein
MFTAAIATLITQVPIENPVVLITGWDQPNSTQFLKHYRKFNELPFTGSNVRATSSTEVQGIGTDLFARAFSKGKWNPKWFDHAITDFQAVAADSSRQLKDNFLIINANPGNVDLMDEQGWTDIIDHVRIAARVAAKGKLRGITFDIEPYVKPFFQFNYAAQPQSKTYSFQDYQKKARTLGQAFIKAIGEEFPNCELLCYHFFDSIGRVQLPGGRVMGVQGEWYDLFPAFVDGWFDAMPRGIKIIDGNELAYHYNDPGDYLSANYRIQQENYQYLDPKHWSAYKKHVATGHAFYLEAYLNPPESPWHVSSKGTTPTKRFTHNVMTALKSSRFVWFYGETHKWWPDGAPKTYWPDAMPGLDNLLNRYLRPEKVANQLISDSQAPNMAKNFDFAANTSSWSTWQHEESKGDFSWQNGKAFMSGVKQGCYIQSIACAPGEFLAFELKAEAKGNASAYCMVRWKTAEGKWTQQSFDRSFTSVNGVIRGYGVVPEGAGEAILLPFGVSTGQKSDTVAFDSVVLKVARDKS